MTSMLGDLKFALRLLARRARLHGARRHHAGPGHRCGHRDLQRGVPDPRGAAAVSARRAHRDGLGARERRLDEQRRLADLRRSQPREHVVRGAGRHVVFERDAHGQRPARAAQRAARLAVVLPRSRCGPGDRPSIPSGGRHTEHASRDRPGQRALAQQVRRRLGHRRQRNHARWQFVYRDRRDAPRLRERGRSVRAILDAAPIRCVAPLFLPRLQAPSRGGTCEGRCLGGASRARDEHDLRRHRARSPHIVLVEQSGRTRAPGRHHPRRSARDARGARRGVPRAAHRLRECDEPAAGAGSAAAG